MIPGGKKKRKRMSEEPAGEALGGAPACAEEEGKRNRQDRRWVERRPEQKKKENGTAGQALGGALACAVGEGKRNRELPREERKGCIISVC